MRLCVSPRKPITPFPIVILNGRMCLPRHLIPKPLPGHGEDFDLEKFLKEFHQRRRYLSAVRVMEQQEDTGNRDVKETQQKPAAATSESDGPEVTLWTSERVQHADHVQTPGSECIICDNCMSDQSGSSHVQQDGELPAHSSCGQWIDVPSSSQPSGSQSLSFGLMRELTPDEISSFFTTV